MPYVDSTSSRDEVRAALDDNASWLVDQSVEKAKLYVVAANVWLGKWAFDRSKAGPSEMDMRDLNKQIAAEKKAAQDYVAAENSASAGRGVTYLSISNFREV